MHDRMSGSTLREWCFSPHSLQRMVERFPELLSDHAILSFEDGDIMPLVHEVRDIAIRSVPNREVRKPTGPHPPGMFDCVNYRTTGDVVFVCRPGDRPDQKFCVTIFRLPVQDRLMREADLIKIRQGQGKYVNRTYKKNHPALRTHFNRDTKSAKPRRK